METKIFSALSQYCLTPRLFPGYAQALRRGVALACDKRHVYISDSLSDKVLKVRRSDSRLMWSQVCLCPLGIAYDIVQDTLCRMQCPTLYKIHSMSFLAATIACKFYMRQTARLWSDSIQEQQEQCPEWEAKGTAGS